MSLILRPYQQSILLRVRDELHAGRDPLIVSPCGSGKGSLIAFMVRNVVSQGKRVIFAVHGKSLVVDMSERVEKLGIPHGVLLGGERRERWHDVQVASIDTLHRMQQPPTADLIIIDEAHGSMSPTWRKALEKYPGVRRIGATATPIRLDGKGLGKATGGLFDSMVMGPTEEDLIGMGNLCGSRVLAPPPPSGMNQIKLGKNDNLGRQSAVCDNTKVIGDIVEHYKRHARGMKFVFFGVDQNHARHVCQQFNEGGVSCAYVDSNTPTGSSKNPLPGTRANIWRDLDEDSSELQGISSVDCVSVGWDHAIVSCIIAGRKSQSLAWWKQALGRASRTFRGKEYFLVLDHVGNTREHGDGMDGRPPWGLFEFSPPWSLDGRAIKEGNGDTVPSISQCLTCYRTFRSGPRECPYCHAEIKFKPRKVEVEAGELQEIARPTPLPFAHPKGDPREYHSELMVKATARNYKPGWVGLNFKGKYGFWPPKKWETDWLSQELKKEMANA